MMEHLGYSGFTNIGIFCASLVNTLSEFIDNFFRKVAEIKLFFSQVVIVGMQFSSIFNWFFGFIFGCWFIGF